MNELDFIKHYEDKLIKAPELQNDPQLRSVAKQTCAEMIFNAPVKNDTQSYAALYAGFHDNCCGEFNQQLRGKEFKNADEAIQAVEERRKRSLLVTFFAQCMMEDPDVDIGSVLIAASRMIGTTNPTVN